MGKIFSSGVFGVLCLAYGILPAFADWSTTAGALHFRVAMARHDLRIYVTDKSGAPVSLDGVSGWVTLKDAQGETFPIKIHAARHASFEIPGSSSPQQPGGAEPDALGSPVGTVPTPGVAVREEHGLMTSSAQPGMAVAEERGVLTRSAPEGSDSSSFAMRPSLPPRAVLGAPAPQAPVPPGAGVAVDEEPYAVFSGAGYLSAQRDFDSFPREKFQSLHLQLSGLAATAGEKSPPPVDLTLSLETPSSTHTPPAVDLPELEK